MTKTSFPPVHD